ncbi:MAG: CoA transferase [Chloroflexi bacterium]|nr:CoA transferase [Chloroflexota bacterium]GIW11565.1 MAG: CoA transferase [Dehalococcoidia bacterium]
MAPLQPLAGLLVLDLTQMASGPYGTMLLADAGATVIKIERPGTGDPARQLPPFLLHPDGAVGAGIIRFGRNKRFLTLNLQSPEGRATFLDLVQRADALWENYVPGTLERLGLGEAVLRAANPRLIHVAISGYGSGVVAPAPFATRPALDLVAQAASGLMAVSGDPGGPPAQVGAVIGDLVPGLYAVIAMLFALRLREQTGEGRFVEVAMVDALAAINERAVAAYSLTGRELSRDWLGHAGPYGRFRARDRDVVIAASIPSLWERLARAIGRPDLLAHAPAPDASGRWWRFGEVMEPALRAWVSDRPAAEVVAVLSEAGVPCALVLGVAELVESEQTRARRLLVEVSVEGERVATMGWPMKIEGVPEPAGGAIQPPGAESEALLRELLGYDAERIAVLRAAGAI